MAAGEIPNDGGTNLLSDRPKHSSAMLATLILGAVVANINLSIANVALPTISRDLGATQVQQTLISSMFTLGLAATVLYLGAIGDRHGRKLLLLLGSGLSIPASIVCALAPNVQVLIGGRLVGGIAAGLLYPTTLSLISALWRGSAKTRAIGIWSGIGGGAATLGSLVGGILLEYFPWGSVFLITAPFALLVLVAAYAIVPWHAGEQGKSIDHVGGVLSVIAVATLVIGLQFVANGFSLTIAVLWVVAAIAFVLFFYRERRAKRPLVDLVRAAKPTFWVAAVAGTISFGSLMGVLYLGTQFTQNVLGYSALEAALVIIPASVVMIPISAYAGRLIPKVGSRAVLSAGIVLLMVAFLAMVLLWRAGASAWAVMIGYALLGGGAGLTVAAASSSLMASVPVSRAGMGSAFADLMRDFGGAVMQALMGTILAVVYADYFTNVFAGLGSAQASQLSTAAANEIVSSYAGAQTVAQSYPQVPAQELINAANAAFTVGKSSAYTVGLIACLVALVIVLWKYPRKAQEQKFFEQIAQESARELTA